MVRMVCMVRLQHRLNLLIHFNSPKYSSKPIFWVQNLL